LVIPTNAVLKVSSRRKFESVGEPPVERRSLDRTRAWRVDPIAAASDDLRR
jgi:hypothetical protein